MDPFALAASTNPNILSHRDAMKADDNIQFHVSMDTEMTQLWVSDIYELKPRSIVPPNQKVLHAIWSHRRKQRPSGEIYKYKSRI